MEPKLRNLYFSAALASTLSFFPSAGSAQGYNTYVITIPYEISLPATVYSAYLMCEFKPGRYRAMIFTSEIDLVNGQAQGSFKVGYDLNGSEPDLLPMTSQNIMLEEFRKWTTEPDFELTAECEVKLQSASGAYDYLFEKNGTYILQSPRGKERVILEGQTDPTVVSAVFGHSDNEASSPAPSVSTTTIPQGLVPSGLQGLESILGSQ